MHTLAGTPSHHAMERDYKGMFWCISCTVCRY